MNKLLFDPFSFPKQFNTTVGFEPILKRLAEMAETMPKMQTYPPYNIKKVDDEHFVIEMAVAGFGKHNLDIELKDGVLSITGNTETEEGDYLHKGIANRAFTRKFTIADTVEVKNAELANGMLNSHAVELFHRHNMRVCIRMIETCVLMNTYNWPSGLERQRQHHL